MVNIWLSARIENIWWARSGVVYKDSNGEIVNLKSLEAKPQASTFLAETIPYPLFHFPSFLCSYNVLNNPQILNLFGYVFSTPTSTHVCTVVFFIFSSQMSPQIFPKWRIEAKDSCIFERVSVNEYTYHVSYRSIGWTSFINAQVIWSCFKNEWASLSTSRLHVIITAAFPTKRTHAIHYCRSYSWQCCRRCSSAHRPVLHTITDTANLAQCVVLL